MHVITLYDGVLITLFASFHNHFVQLWGNSIGVHREHVIVEHKSSVCILRFSGNIVHKHNCPQIVRIVTMSSSSSTAVISVHTVCEERQRKPKSLNEDDSRNDPSLQRW